ncbi:TauD/TfdA family dioxygenase [Phytohabitans suffuscus]|uniref:Syringomycin biosynthesis enzyme n=1 Tax=Phytohabitans suffuscus TaxID=624315 RepID=A0A6F8Z0W7_9ACTN|nr:TauD/TfdA family dioxygenase [Phytohabitans suffuscus]BCB91966.1 syringomycin biosynthesis enzyme [Phytohabitans suffuscus]
MTENASWKPLEITPESAGVAATVDGLADHIATLDVERALTAEKALVFRGFGVRPDTLDRVMDPLLPNRLAYVHGNSPRTKVGANVYTSTEYPSRFTISMHNELSYAAHWPSRLMFFCEIAAETGGATPLVDAALWLESLDPHVREAFAGGVRYQQNLHDGMGLGKSWQETFETDDRAEVESFLAGSGATWEWTADGLRVIQVRPSTTRHPVTGVEVWFNQSDQWHPAALDDETAKVMAEVMGEDELPQSVRFADGSPIPGEYVVQVRDRGLEAAVDVDWRVGDVLLIDNLLVAHGRRSYTGDRRVLVAMTD